jgi:hypothetical protein
MTNSTLNINRDRNEANRYNKSGYDDTENNPLIGGCITEQNSSSVIIQRWESHESQRPESERATTNPFGALIRFFLCHVESRNTFAPWLLLPGEEREMAQRTPWIITLTRIIIRNQCKSVSPCHSHFASNHALMQPLFPFWLMIDCSARIPERIVLLWSKY